LPNCVGLFMTMIFWKKHHCDSNYA
jgi:hypothetical protein